MSSERFSAISKIAQYIPEVPRPLRKPTLKVRLLWTLLILVLYVTMGFISLYKVTVSAQVLPLYQIVFAAQQGTLTSLGIGPIVTGGLLAEILVGSEIINLDFSREEDKAAFTAMVKVFTIVFIIIESVAYTVGMLGFYYHVPLSALPIDAIQLILAGIVVYMLDQMIQKGWGVGSGISLFILANVALLVMVDLFNPVKVAGQFFGIIPFLVQAALSGNIYAAVLRPNGYPSLVGLGATVAFILLLVYLEGVRIEVPVTSSQYRGIAGTYPIKLLYVSNVPVILVAALLANIQMIASWWASWARTSGLWYASMLAQYNSQGQLVGGLLYYLIGPQTLQQAISNPLLAVLFVAIMTVLSTAFAKVWVEMSGMSAEKAADGLIKAQMAIPGFRSTRSTVGMMLGRWIPVVTLLGGALVGLIAGISQFLGVFGGGIGLLLMVDIAIQYYQTLIQEELEFIMPRLAGIFGR
ncbi:MAG: preprotein translocase subunit SecY [Conexivisphaerales archaeon]|nr:preprotein translocase subunit SecY [Conexivisphaerales archaeon]